MPPKRKTMTLDSDDDLDAANNNSDDEDLFKKPKTQKHNVPNLVDGPSDFIDSLVSFGFYLKGGKEPNQLGKHPSVFREKISEHLGLTGLSQSRNVQFFIDDCKTFFSDTQNFVKALQPTCSEQVDDAFVVPQDSLVRILLNVPKLQSKILEILLDKLDDYAKGKLKKVSGVNLPSLILSQMSWLIHMDQSSSVIDRLLEILAISPLEMKRELISHLPGIATNGDQIRVAFALCEILPENPNLTAAVLEALKDVHLPSIEAAELRSQVIKRIGSAPLETLPVLIQFVLRGITNEEAQSLIRSLRDSLDEPLRNIKPGPSQRKASNTDCLSLCVENLYLSFRYKIVADVWFKLLKSLDEFCPLDVIVLMLLHKVAGRSKAVESLFKIKVRSEVITDELLKETFRVYSKALDNYFDQLNEIANSLYSSKDPIIVPCGSNMFKEMFNSFDFYYQQEVVRNLIRRISMGDSTISTAALQTLQDLSENSWSELIRFSSFIVSLLEYLEETNLSQIRGIMRLLARMAYGVNKESTEARYSSFTSSVQSELQMVIRKQLTHVRTEYQRMGVVGSIAIIQVLVDSDIIGDLTPTDLDATAASFISTQVDSDASVSGRIKLARKLFKLARKCAKRNAAMTGLFYDEFASTILRSELSPHLEIFSTVIEDFQENFIVDCKEGDVVEDSLVPLAPQYGLDPLDDNSIALNLAPMVMEEMSKKTKTDSSHDEKPSLITLFPHFRLVYQTAANDLEQISALLGCHVWLPTSETLDKFADLSQKEKDFICTCLLHAVNWFVEVVNAFARERSFETRVKVNRRLRHIIEVKEQLLKCLAQNPLFNLMRPIFDDDAQPKSFTSSSAIPKSAPAKKGRGRGRGKKAALSDSTSQASASMVMHSTPNTSQRAGPDFTLTQPKEPEPARVISLRPYLRELDLTVFTLLTSSLPLNNAEQSQANVEIRPEELEFLLEDLNCKIEHSLVSSKRHFPSHAGADKGSFAKLDFFIPPSVAKRCVILLKRICKHLEDISGYFQTLIGDNDGILDAPGMFTELSPVLSNCYALALRFLASLFSWHEFRKTEHKAILIDALKHLASRIEPVTEESNIEDLVSVAFRYASNFGSSVPVFSCAVEQIALLQALLGVHSTPEMSEKLADQALNFLKRDWCNAEGLPDRGPKFNQGFDAILKAYITNGDDVFGKIEALATSAMQEVLKARSKDGAANEYPTFCKSTFSVFFRVMLSSLINGTKKLCQEERVPADALKMWSTSVTVLSHFISASKVDNKQAVLSPCLKYGRLYLDLFLRQAVPVLEKMFKTHSADCQQLLKNLQSSTRTLHQVCIFTKCSRNASLASYVPALRKSLETFVFKVKGILAANGCAQAFWLGNLKNKNLQGEEILSQSTVNDDDDESEAASQNDPDEEDDDVTVLGENQSDDESGGGPPSVSEAY